MTETFTPDALAAEFDIFMRRAGLTIPPDRLPALLTGYADLRAQLPLLRQPRTAAAEPSNVFRLVPAGA
jgi:hypothetical protein